MAGKLIVISGPPGAGKSTLSRALASPAPDAEPVALVVGDAFWSHWVLPEGSQRQDAEGRHKRFKAVVMASTAAALAYAMYGFDAVLDFSIPPGHLPSIVKMAAARNVALSFIVLLPAKELCAARAASRSEGKIEDYSSLEVFYDQFAAAPKANVVAVGSDASVDVLLAKLRAGLQEGAFAVS